MLKIYGIPNCDTCRDARKWLKSNGLEHVFHDIRLDGLELQAIHRWANNVGWETLLNTRSATWRKIAQADREEVDEGRALTLMYEQPTLIKRPVLEHEDQLMVGFSADKYAALLNR